MAIFEEGIPEFKIVLYILIAAAASSGLAPEAPSIRPFLTLHQSM